MPTPLCLQAIKYNDKTLAYKLFSNLERKILALGSDRKAAFLFQRVSVLVQHFNAVLLHDSLLALICT